MEAKWLRAVDANANRAREGLRVCEDVCRFLWDDAAATRGLREVRHALSAVLREWMGEAVAARDTAGDVAASSRFDRPVRGGSEDIFFANIQRVKEALRVLEEFAKWLRPSSAGDIKRLRYRVYDLEKRLFVARRREGR